MITPQTTHKNTGNTVCSKKIWLLFISIYTTQYIGLSFILAGSVVIMREFGMPLDKLALINIIALPILLKIVYAPFIDYVRPPWLFKKMQGQYRSWLLLAQIAMALLLLLLSFLNIKYQFSLVLIIMLLYALAVSVQDVAIDGLACKFFTEDERKFANSVQFSSNLLGNLIGGGVLLIMYNVLGWQGSFLLLALCTAVSLGQVITFTEVSAEQRLGHSLAHTDAITQVPITLKAQFKQFCSVLKDFIKQQKVWLGLLLLYPIGFSSCFGLLKPLLVDAGWLKAEIGFTLNIYGSLVGVLSALGASLVIKKYNKYNALIGLTVAQTLVLLFLLPVGLGYTNNIAVYGAVTLYSMAHPALITTIATHCMDKASTQNAKSSVFTLQISLIFFMSFVYSGLGTVLAKHLGYSAVMLCSFTASALMTLYVIRKKATLR